MDLAEPVTAIRGREEIYCMHTAPHLACGSPRASSTNIRGTIKVQSSPGAGTLISMFSRTTESVSPWLPSVAFGLDHYRTDLRKEPCRTAGQRNSTPLPCSCNSYDTRRRTNIAKPNSPVPSSIRLEGSGVGFTMVPITPSENDGNTPPLFAFVKLTPKNDEFQN